MKVGVIGSGAIGPDLAYGFATSLARDKGARVYLVDIRQEALDAGMKRINAYVRKGVSRGKLSPKVGAAVQDNLIPTLDIADLADCDYVLEAATEDLPVKKALIAKLEEVVRPDCLIGFATSGIPRAWIAAEAKHPERCFVNHPFFPAWRSPPVEVVLSDDEALSQQMIDVLRSLGKVPIVTADVACFAADDIFVNYCAEAARIVAEGTATPAQVDAIVNEAVGGGGPFNVMDLTKGNLLNVHCMDLMAEANGTEWFAPPEIFSIQANTPWHDRRNPGDPAHTDELKQHVLDRMLAVMIGRTYFVVDHDICDPADTNWLTRTALGFRTGLLDLAEELGAERVHDICTRYAAQYPGFEVPPTIAAGELVDFHRNVKLSVDAGIATVSIQRPEVKNALDDRTMAELDEVFTRLAEDDEVMGVVLTSWDGSLAGADIGGLAAIKTPEEAYDKVLAGHRVLDRIEAFPKPVVAAVDGPVLGGGSELSMACHARVVGRGLLLGQPEVNLGLIPGYGGTQRLPRLVGFELGVDLLRTGRSLGAREAWESGWASGEPVDDPVAAAVDLVRAHLQGSRKVTPVDPGPMAVPGAFPPTDIGHRSIAIDAILCDVLRMGLALPLEAGLELERQGSVRCKATIDYDIGMKNFIQNGPRTPAVFVHE